MFGSVEQTVRINLRDFTIIIFFQKFAKEYRAHLKEKEKGKEIRRDEKRKIREDVNRTAFREMELKLERAKEELRSQEEYRRNLEYQIQNNQKVMVGFVFIVNHPTQHTSIIDILSYQR